MRKAWSLWRGLKGQSQNRNIFRFSILNIFLCYPKHNPFSQCRIKLFIFSLSASSCSLEPKPSKIKALENVFLFFPILTQSRKEESTYRNIKYKIIGWKEFHLYGVSIHLLGLFLFYFIFFPMVAIPQGLLCPTAFSLGSVESPFL